jgi:hypothetical protein
MRLLAVLRLPDARCSQVRPFKPKWRSNLLRSALRRAWRKLSEEKRLFLGNGPSLGGLLKGEEAAG